MEDVEYHYNEASTYAKEFFDVDDDVDNGPASPIGTNTGSLNSGYNSRQRRYRFLKQGTYDDKDTKKIIFSEGRM